MGMRDLTSADRQLVRECLDVVVNGPLFPDEEFHALFGIERAEAAQVLRQWPNVDDRNEVVFLAVNNAIGNLLGYPHGKDLKKYLSATEYLDGVLARWRMSLE